ncbi:hypothetical protein RFI_38236, partial [Reticulomyxa filosa]
MTVKKNLSVGNATSGLKAIMDNFLLYLYIQQHFIFILQKKNRLKKHELMHNIVSGKYETAKDVKKELDNDNETKVSYATVTRTLKEMLEFTNKHKIWTVDDCKKVMFSDETKINLCGSDSIKYVWKRPNQDLGDRDIIKRSRFGGCSIMVWAFFGTK